MNSYPFVFNMMDMLSAPIITYSSSWANTIPKRLKKAVTQSRIEMFAKSEPIASDEEIVAYLMTRTLEAPMDTNWTNIYLYTSCLVYEKRFNEDHWKEIFPHKRLTDYEKHLLYNLKCQIFETRRKHVKERMKNASNKNRERVTT